MARLVFTLFVFSALAVLSAGARHHHQTPSPSPSSDCSILILNMADCLSFLAVGSNDTKPTSDCCSGFKMVLKEDAKCICQSIKNSADLGINMTKAATLPSACKVSAPSVQGCNVNPPESPPEHSPSPSLASPPSPAPAGEEGDSPGPAVPKAGSGTLSVSLVAIFTSFTLVLFTYI
ncbi:non-specific lipid-transfer protein-like protein At5g64080 isoform X2 [Carica papaya]|uniref:non-specific lipid-transfer protein-like protein At5g64080 isoform X2 n=1 Tax=Carica papaya TaxID=3649 RepID=UPI000B8CE26A|nr:non-specific lipid-transfer protein-like protein At5g64080 isoform X2 [Carica papaya]